jgi:iron(III) transport system substrate-binding protein
MTARRFALAGMIAVLGACTRQSSQDVVVYTSVDDVFARPIAGAFEQETGRRVRLVPDTEETKSTGLLNRLLAERERPQADVFWSGDPVRAAILKANGISAPYQSPQANGLPAQFSDPEHHWTGFSARARVLIYNRDLVVGDTAPRSVSDLLAPRFAAKACIANPLFGTTSMHAAALFSVLGDERARAFFDALLANGGKVVASNGDVRRRVANGECAVGITDTDDARVAQLEGKPIGVVYPDADGMGTLIVPNCAVLIANGPNPAGGRAFIDYLLRPETEAALAASPAAQMPLRSGVPIPTGIVPIGDLHPMRVEYADLAARLPELSTGFLKAWVDRAS